MIHSCSEIEKNDLLRKFEELSIFKKKQDSLSQVMKLERASTMIMERSPSGKHSSFMSQSGW